MADFISTANVNDISLSQPLILEAAKELAQDMKINNFEASKGFFYKFKKRQKVVHENLFGESKSVNEETVNEWKQKLPELIKEYEPQDVFNADELGLFYRLQPSKTYTFKGQKCKGGKKSRERVTILLCSNMNGTEKFDLFAIGKSANPKSFKEIRKNHKSLPFIYRNNSNSWMTSKFFEEFISILNSRMIKKDRKILLFVDNCTAHKHLEYSNVKLIFLPSNSTSVLQPMDQGIIKCFKSFYKKRLVQKMIKHLYTKNQRLDLNKFPLGDALLMAKSAWNDVSSETITNCFIKSGFDKNLQLANETENDDGTILWDQAKDIIDASDITFEEFVNADNNLYTSNALEFQDTINKLNSKGKSTNFEFIFNSGSETEIEDENENEESEEDNEISAKTIPNFTQVFDAIEKVRLYLMKLDLNDGTINMIDKIEESIISNRIATAKQTHITDFFNKTV